MLKKILGLGIVCVCALGLSISANAGSYGWQRDENGWWFDNGNGTYPVETVEEIDIDSNGETDNIYYWFMFDENGYLVTNERFTLEGSSYYIDGSGYIHDTGNGDIMLTDKRGEIPAYGWYVDENGWWFSNGDGTYLADTVEEIDIDVNNETDNIYYWFMFDKDGYLVTNERFTLEGSSYYIDGSGYIHDTGSGDIMLTDKRGEIPAYGWYVDENGWWFSNGDGTYLADTVEEIDIDSNGETDNVYYWFMFDENGYLVTNEQFTLEGTTYYIDGSGYIHDTGKGDIMLTDKRN